MEVSFLPLSPLVDSLLVQSLGTDLFVFSLHFRRMELHESLRDPADVEETRRKRLEQQSSLDDRSRPSFLFPFPFTTASFLSS